MSLRGMSLRAALETVALRQRPVEKPRKPYKLSQAQTLLLIHLRELGLEAVPEFRFHEARKWRFDAWIPEARIGIELDGGMFSGGRHSKGLSHMRGAALIGDYEKQNVAQMMGIRILRFTNHQVERGEAKEFIKTWL